MIKLLKSDNGMNILGQGGKILLFATPFVAGAVLLHRVWPALAALPASWGFMRTLGWAWLVPGALLWLGGLVQLLTTFPKGKLVTSGAYGVCRNPIYASFIVFVLPALSLLTLTWVYLAAALAMYIGVRLFIGREERKLLQVFGEEYAGYLQRASRIFPFVRPGRKG